MRNLTILGHPNSQSLCGALARAHHSAASALGDSQLLELGALDFDPVLHAGYGASQPLEADLEAAKRSIEGADHLTLIFPIWWGSTPALLKGFLDRVLLPDWAFHYENGRAQPLLTGRSARVIATCDAPGWYDRFYYGASAIRAMTRPTLQLVGFRPIRVTRLSEVHAASPEQRARWIADMDVLARKDLGTGAAPSRGENPGAREARLE
ncbi:MAG: NAD(P)H-dependent oxidoreductase [Myxococcota bacterium]